MPLYRVKQVGWWQECTSAMRRERVKRRTKGTQQLALRPVSDADALAADGSLGPARPTPPSPAIKPCQVIGCFPGAEAPHDAERDDAARLHPARELAPENAQVID